MRKLIILIPLLFILMSCGKTKEDDFTYEMVDNGYIISSYLGSNKNVTLPKNHNDLPILGIKENAFRDSKITSITFSDSIEYIEQFAFSNSNISKIKLNDKLKTIESYAFYGCQKLNNISIPKSVEKIGALAFYNTAYYKKQTGLVYIDDILIGYKNNEQGDDYSLTVKEGTRLIAESAFERPATSTTSGIISITLPDSLEIINDRAFYKCGTLKNLDLKNVKIIGNNAFTYSLRTTSLELNCDYIGDYAFYECNFKSLSIDCFSIGEKAFAHSWVEDEGLKEITIPEKTLHIGDYCFEGYEGLIITNHSKSSFLPKWNYNIDCPYETK